MNTSITRRHALKTVAAVAVAPFAGSFAADGPARIRIGQIGTSHAHAAGKMEAVRSLTDLYEIVGIAEPIAGRQAGAEKQKAYAGLKWLTEEALLSDKAVKAVVVETTLGDSARAALACLRAGKHIHLDKPGADAHSAFKALRLEAERRRLTVQMGYMLRYNPAFELLFRAHREGWLGKITEINASMGKLADLQIQEDLARIPGYGMFELGCHLVDAAVFLLGAPSAVHAFGKPTGLAPAGLPDNQLAIMEYPNAVVTIRCNHGDPFGGPHRRFHVVGTKGAMEIQPLESGRGALYLTEAKDGFKKGENILALEVPKGRYTGEFRDLARVLRGEKRLAWSAEHDIAVHATALRCAGLTLS
ncbi:MAG: Gfo/Idh/MocA family oxidoreductase [Verrucomicrobia bacterium]|nr:Gfo/Idh/MocA family oxidoreductase [Verrucomicrobiota bacterium]